MTIKAPTATEDSVLVDQESQKFLHLLDQETELRKHREKDIKTVLVILSNRGLTFDVASLKQKITLAYPGAQVFFKATGGGDCFGPAAPSQVDLLIDFTAPGAHQHLGMFLKFRMQGRIVIGRNKGIARKLLYNRVFDEKNPELDLPRDLLQSERIVQREVLALAGIPLSQHGDVLMDESAAMGFNTAQSRVTGSKNR